MKYSKITISGKICTGKTTLFWDLQRKLNWPTVSTSQFFRDYARTHHISLENADEQNELLTKEVDLRVRDLVQKSRHIIAEGWMTGIMTESIPDVLRILLIADDIVRIQRFMMREHISQDQATEKVAKREQNWIKKTSKIYQRHDFFDPKHYNLMIDTTNLKQEEVTKKVLKIQDLS